MPSPAVVTDVLLERLGRRRKLCVELAGVLAFLFTASKTVFRYIRLQWVSRAPLLMLHMSYYKWFA
jgi:hypothetical protein